MHAPSADAGTPPARGLLLHYQPQLDLATGLWHGVEALLRQQDPVRGLLPPLDLVRRAEDNAGIHRLGRWVLREACAQAAAWHRAGWPVGRLAVNVSALQWQHPGFGEAVLETVAATGLPPDRLVLEVTESRRLPMRPDLLADLMRCRNAGIGLSLDDFGVAHNSLAALLALPVTQVKLDRSLVRHLPGDRRAGSIVRHMVALVRELAIEVVAEGVERPGQARWLAEAGCHAFQGHLAYPALPPQQVPAACAGPGWQPDAPAGVGGEPTVPGPLPSAARRPLRPRRARTGCSRRGGPGHRPR